MDYHNPIISSPTLKMTVGESTYELTALVAWSRDPDNPHYTYNAVAIQLPFCIDGTASNYLISACLSACVRELGTSDLSIDAKLARHVPDGVLKENGFIPMGDGSFIYSVDE